MLPDDEQSRAARHEENLRYLRNFRLLDDDFMTAVFEDKACAELLLRIILQRDDLTVQETHTQYSMKNLQGRSVRLDIYATDTEGRKYNVEVQRSDHGAGMRRARYNSSLIDANITEPGDSYEALPETYVIFITEHDVLKRGLPLYHIRRTIEQTGECFEDGSHILYVNNQIRDDTALGRLMHDFTCTSAEEMHYSALSERVRYFKEDEKGVSSMCKAMEDRCKREREDAVQIERYKNARQMLVDGALSYQKIALYSGLTLSEVEALAAKESA